MPGEKVMVIANVANASPKKVKSVEAFIIQVGYWFSEEFEINLRQFL